MLCVLRVGQLRVQLWEAYCEVRSLCSHLRGNDITDSALSTDSSMDESSETSSAKDVPTGSLRASLLELRRLTQNLLDGNESTVGESLLAQRRAPLGAGGSRWNLLESFIPTPPMQRSAVRLRQR